MKKKQVTAIVGAQWGDEGKGKICDYYANDADIIVRWNGGDNAGHTIVFNGQNHKLSIIPSGIFNDKKTCVIANGCVVNVEKLVAEINYLNNKGFKVNNLKISDRAHIIFPYHQLLDQYEEKMKQEWAVGTTKKGIGPCYADKVNRLGIRIGELLNKDAFVKKIKFIVAWKNKILQQIYHHQELIAVDSLINRIYNVLLPKFQPYIGDTSALLQEALKNNKRILFEGAQGTLLDLDHGTYPYVTSSNPTASSIASGAGIAFKNINNIIGVTKAYNTRVGAGVFPSEFEDEIAQYIRKTAHEYGTVSMRPRRIGWFDAVIVKYSANINGFTGLAIMLLDVLTGIEELKICTHYLLDGKKITYIPSRIEDFARCQPQYITLAGWKKDISKVTSFMELPKAAQNYLQTISDLIGVPIILFSVGPDRQQTVLMEAN